MSCRRALFPVLEVFSNRPFKVSLNIEGVLNKVWRMIGFMLSERSKEPEQNCMKISG